MCSKVVLNDGYVVCLNFNIVDFFYIFIIVYVFVLLCVGILGNVLVVYVYILWWWFFFCFVIIVLVVFDFVNCLFIIFMEIYFILNIYLDLNLILCKVICFFIFFMNNVLFFVFLFIVVDWFKRIYKFFKFLFSNWIIKIMIGISFVVVFIFFWLFLLIYGRQIFNILLFNDICIRVCICFIDDDVKISIYLLLFNIIFMVGIIFIDIIMIFVYVYIGSRLIKVIREINCFFLKFVFNINDIMDFFVEYL